MEKEFTKLKDGSILTDGNSKIRDLNNYLNWAIPEDNSKTINGLITEYLDQIPQANLCIEVNNYRFEILELDENSISKLFDILGFSVKNFPLSDYRNKTFYTMRTDSLDRFGTKLEHRYTKQEIENMMEVSGLENIEFDEDNAPYWCAVGYKR